MSASGAMCRSRRSARSPHRHGRALNPREQHSAVLTAGLLRTEILKSLLVWTVPAFAPMSLLWFKRLLKERVRYRLRIGVAKATREYTIQNPDSNPSEGTDAGDQVVLQFAH